MGTLSRVKKVRYYVQTWWDIFSFMEDSMLCSVSFDRKALMDQAKNISSSSSFEMFVLQVPDPFFRSQVTYFVNQKKNLLLS